MVRKVTPGRWRSPYSRGSEIATIQSKAKEKCEKKSCCCRAKPGTRRPCPRRTELHSRAVVIFARGGGRRGSRKLPPSVRSLTMTGSPSWPMVFQMRRDGPGGDFGRRDARHSRLVRCLGRAFGNQGTVERDRGTDPARNGPPGSGFGAGCRVGTAAGSAGLGGRRSRRDESEPPRLDFRRRSAAPVPPAGVAHSVTPFLA